MAEKKIKKTSSNTTHEEDKALVIKAIGNDQRAYNVLGNKYRKILFIAAKRRLPYKNTEDIEDIVMFVLGTAFVKIHQYDPEKSLFFTWILACLHNYVNSIPAQKKRVTTSSIEDMHAYEADSEVKTEYEIPFEDTFDKSMDNERFSFLVKSLIDKLPAESYEIIKLRYFKELSHREIAERMNCKESEVWSKLKTAKERLKRMTNIKNLKNEI